MTTLFIADIHLCPKEPVITAGFLHFLRYRAYYADALYILGDLFEIWIGDDNPSPLHTEVAAALKALSKQGVPCYFIHGNHDFLLGNRYAAACNMRLLPAQQVLKLAGQLIVILHGDTLCTTDISYQYLRQQVHKTWLQRLFTQLPLFIRLWIADRIRLNSAQAKLGKTANSMDVHLQAVIEVLAKTGANIIIHGHTHRPAIHSIMTANGSCYRIVLGVWRQQGSVIEISTNSIKLTKFPFGN